MISDIKLQLNLLGVYFDYSWGFFPLGYEFFVPKYFENKML